MTTTMDSYRFNQASIALTVAIESINLRLRNSYGTPTMSPEDTKSSIIHITLALDDIKDFMNKMQADLDREEPKKTFWQKIFRK